MNRKDIRTSQRLAGLIKRYHTWPVTREQNVAEHTWHVMRIYVALFGAMTGEVAVYIMYHDIGEMGTGDIPSDCKTPELRAILQKMEEQTLREMKAPEVEIPALDKVRVKLCDMIEFWEYGQEELARGNRFAAPIVEFGAEPILTLAQKISDSTYHDVGLYMTRFIPSMS